MLAGAQDQTLQCKAVLIGASGSGKTSLIHRLVHNDFEPQPRTTLGAGLSSYYTEFEGQRIKLNIWDTAGQENYRSLARIYFRDAHCVLVVYDLSDHSTYDEVQYWLAELEQTAPEGHFVMLVANKCDLRSTRTVSEDEGVEIAQAAKAPYHEVSARSGEGVASLFQEIAEQFVKRQNQRKIGDHANLGDSLQGSNNGCC
jgi:small GTP-binding protein